MKTYLALMNNKLGQTVKSSSLPIHTTDFHLSRDIINYGALDSQGPKYTGCLRRFFLEPSISDCLFKRHTKFKEELVELAMFNCPHYKSLKFAMFIALEICEIGIG